MLTRCTDIKKFQKALLCWYQKNKRELPFRKTKDPYQIWLSEVMAQQTTMPVVVDYFSRFIKQYPDVFSVARASEQALLLQWQGLGYYARCRNFQKASQEVVAKHAGQVPRTYVELIKLKGIGDYTASAIASICFDEPRAVVDGNVKRVIARLFAYKKNSAQKEAIVFFEQKARALLSVRSPGDFNQAMMELGALVCGKIPQCQNCPVNRFCKAKDRHPERLPVVKKTRYQNRQIASLLLFKGRSIVLKAPAKDSLIEGLWELPTLYRYQQKTEIKDWNVLLGQGWVMGKTDCLGKVNHAITNKRIVAHVFAGRLTSSSLTKRHLNGFKVVSRRALKALPINTLTRKILDQYFI
ncbi:MAG: hypothetical protein ACD_62C00283G0002 [uncultured bacterium]|nr:MAG: hypothetical protein ACD_62C00283G0002 [uncultured bacterium]